MERVTARTENQAIKVLAWVFASLVLFVALCWGGNLLYHQWQEKRLGRHAELAWAKGDFARATVAAQRAYQVDPKNVNACRMLARLAEREGQPSALEWRQRVLTLRPDSVEDSIALAKTALQFGQFALAELALSKVESGAAHLASYHDAAAQLAVSKKDAASAQSHFQEAARLDPQNKAYQLNVAVFDLQSSSPEVRSKASLLLKSFMDDAQLRVPAARAMLNYAIQRKDLPAAIDISDSLRGYPEASFRDRVYHVELLHDLNSPEFVQNLTRVQDEAAADPAKLTELLSWMNASHLSLLAIDWIKRLPPEAKTKRPVPVAIAECYAAVDDWPGLKEWCKKPIWGDLEFLRHAFLARVARAQGDSLGYEGEWAAALKAAGANSEALFSLRQNVAKWQWQKEAIEVSWLLTKDPKRQNEALAALHQYYTEKADTGNLYRVLARLCEIRPEDDKLQNNFAQLSLLLQVDQDHAHAMAEKLYAKDRTNPIFASTYGFSLYAKGLYPQAVKVMSELSPDDLRRPALAAYYGMFLAAAGDKTKAAEYLQIGSNAPLLPEEKALVEKALASIKP